MTTTKQWDKLNRLTNIVSTTNAVAMTRSAYAYNLASQRTRNTQADGSYWSYGYDTLGQVTNSHKYWSNAVPVAGHQFDYLYDDIGNRKSAWEGGDASGANLRRSDYTANALNQYTQRTVPGYAFDIGSANTNAYVSVNLQPVNRHGEYYWLEWAATNTSAPVWLGLTNFAVLHSATNDLVASSVGHLFVPKTPETYTHDADGNLTNDGRFAYAWDGENRLTSMTANTAVGIKERLDFKYDAQSRRIRKRVWTNWDGAAGTLISLQQYVYDGWNLVAILDANNVVQQSFTWGLDQSGTEQGAGGVGGLLTMRIHTGALAGTYFYCYDGNGNITALINAADGSIAAQYEYSPFGQLLRATGPLAFVNPFRFSTKYQDDETGLYYYGYRYYDPSTGRWLPRDPINEIGFHLQRTGKQIFQLPDNDGSPIGDESEREYPNEFLIGTGGLNSYGFNANNAIFFIDYLGLAPFCVCIQTDESDHAWISVTDLATGTRHTYGRWAIGYPRNAPAKARTSGVNTDMEIKRTPKASRCVKVQSFTPTINAGYNLYNNNCSTYAWSEWKRVSGEDLDKAGISSGTFDSPVILKESILKKNGGKSSVECCK
jgi:RHS repeat-associated protein